MEHKPVVCILAAGRGLRMGNLTQKTNKALLPIGSKAAISLLIEMFPEHEIVVAVHYQSEQIRDYLQAAYPNWPIKVVYVVDGSRGPGHSLKACRSHLKRPFYLLTVDTFIQESVPPIDSNWIGLSLESDRSKYSTAELFEGQVIQFRDKNPEPLTYVFNGIVGILDYQKFWDTLDSLAEEGEKEFVSVFCDPAKLNLQGKVFTTWQDLGDLERYQRVKSLFRSCSIEKEIDEITYNVNGKYIKLIFDPVRLSNRMKVSVRLKPYIPKIGYTGNQLYSYDWVEGATLYQLDDFELMKQFISWCNKTIWASSVDEPSFSEATKKFYYTKTYQRLEQFLAKKDESFRSWHVINGRHCPGIYSLLNKIHWEDLYKGIPVNFHGDLQFDNVVYSGERFYLIDWREDFGGLVNCGDLYYDFAKLYGGMLLSHYDMRTPGNCMVEEVNSFTYNLKHSLAICQSRVKTYFEEWLSLRGFNLRKIRVLTALVYLNMAPLHVNGLGEFLFFKAKHMLTEFV